MRRSILKRLMVLLLGLSLADSGGALIPTAYGVFGVYASTSAAAKTGAG